MVWFDESMLSDKWGGVGAKFGRLTRTVHCFTDVLSYHCSVSEYSLPIGEGKLTIKHTTIGGHP